MEAPAGPRSSRGRHSPWGLLVGRPMGPEIEQAGGVRCLGTVPEVSKMAWAYEERPVGASGEGRQVAL